MTAINIVKFYHGGVPGLKPGDLIYPPSVTKSKTAPGRRAIGSAKRKYRDDRVYITPDFKFALFFAAMHPSGQGLVYVVEPIGELEIDPHWELIQSEGTGYSETKQCESARIVCIADIPEGMFAAARALMAPTTQDGVDYTENKFERTLREARERRQRTSAKRAQRR